MTKREILTTYRAIVIELNELRGQLERVGTDGRPMGYRGLEMGRIAGTNDPAAAAVQLADGLEEMMRRKEEELAALGKQVDGLLKEIRDYRTYMVILHYYVYGRTDDEVARALCISRGRVTQIRLDYFLPA